MIRLLGFKKTLIYM